MSLSEERAGYRRARAPRPLVDVAMTASAVTALVLLLVWFFFIAEMQLAPMAMSWLTVPKDWIASFGDIARFMARVMGEVYSGRVLRFFGEALRQAGILILGSALVILGPGLHPRPHLRDRGRLLLAQRGRARAGRRLLAPGATCAR